MVRKLKFHEKKLLKKVDFISWKSDNNLREVKILRKYHIQKREDYTKYNKVCGMVRSLANKIKHLDAKDPFRAEATEQLLEKLYSLGLITTKKNLSLCEKLSSSAFCRRRLPVVMVRLRMAQAVKDAVKYIEQGHVRVGPEVITDPAFLVTKNMEDFVTWTDTSKIRKHIMEYNDLRDDYDFSWKQTTLFNLVKTENMPFDEMFGIQFVSTWTLYALTTVYCSLYIFNGADRREFV